MQTQLGFSRVISLLFGMVICAVAGLASADPPARVGRLSYISGAVSFSPAGEQDWVEAAINRPLIAGDRLWVDAGARAELQVGSSVVRMGANTSVTLVNLDDRVLQLQLSQGTVAVRVRRLGPRDLVEVDTPNLAYSVKRPGRYRLEVDTKSPDTTVLVREGQGEVYGDGASYIVKAGQNYRFFGTDLGDYDSIPAPRRDALDTWSDERDRRGDKSVAARYVSRDVVGYEDLDEYGSWRTAEGYGNVWVPNRVASDWTPYQNGHWSWVEPWGWTWIDDAPWGFAVSHYGRWANMRGTWGWVPGPVRAQPVYAPALVAFIGGDNFRLSTSSGSGGAVGWFPLAPREVYRPSYAVSRGYINNINTSNTTVNTTTITNVYNNTNVRNITYVNRQVAGAVTAVPHSAFVQSEPVAKHSTRISRDEAARAPVTPVAAVTPVETSVHGGGARSGRRPPPEDRARPIVSKAPPPPPPVPFAAKQHELAQNPGMPLAAAALAAAAVAASKTAAPAPAPVKVVAPTQPAVAPPAQPPGGRRGADNGDSRRGSRFESRTGQQPPEVQKGSPQPGAAPSTQGAQRTPPTGSPVPDSQKGQRPFEGRKGEQPPEAPKAPPPPLTTPAPQEAPKAPPVSVPRPPEEPKGQRLFEGRKGPPAPEPQKAPQPPVIAPAAPEAPKAPPVSVPRPPEEQKGQRPFEGRRGGAPASDAQQGQEGRDNRRGPPDSQRGPQSPEGRDSRRGPQPPVSAPTPPEAPKAPPPPVSAPRPPEPPKAPPAPVSIPRPPEPPPAPPPPVRAPEPPKAPAPPVSAPRPPEPPKAPPPPVSVPRPPEPPKAPPPPAPPPPPPAPVAPLPLPPAPPASPPKPPEAQKAPPGKSEGRKKGDDVDDRKK